CSRRTLKAELGGDNVQLYCVTVMGGVVLMRHRVEAVIDHPQSIAQIVSTPVSSCVVGKICCGTCAVRRVIVFVKTRVRDRESEVVFHPDMPYDRPELQVVKPNDSPRPKSRSGDVTKRMAASDAPSAVRKR